MADRNKTPKNSSDEASEKEQDKYSFDDLDKEVGLGDILKEKDSVFLVMVKKVMFIVIIIIVSIIVFFASFTIGKMMFMTDQSELTTEGIPSENIIESNAPDTVQTANGQAIALTEKPSPTLSEKVEQPVTKPVVKVTPKPLPKPEPVKKAVTETPKPIVLPVKPLVKSIAKTVAVVTEKKSIVAPITKNITKSNLKPMIKPIEKPAATVVTPAIVKQVAEPSMMIVAGTFSKIENANIIKTKLISLGFAPSVTEIQHEGKTLLRVTAGTFPKSESSKKITLLRGKGIECFAAPAK